MENQSVEESDTPSEDDGLVEIDDDATAKSGEAKDTFIRNMIVGIIIALIAIAIIIITLIIAMKKKKAIKTNSDQKAE